MPRRVGRPRKRRVIRGAGFFGDLWSGIKKAGNYIKQNQLLSKGLALIPNTKAQTASRVAAQLGLGRRRRKAPARRRMRGGASVVRF